METIIKKSLKESVEAKQKLEGMSKEIEQMCKIIVNCYKNKGKMVILGNGGSAADAQHIAAELVCLLDRKNERPSIPAIALTVNTSILTAIGNDMGYEHLFSRQVHDMVAENDVVIGISTSGNSANVIKALESAKEKGAKAIAWTGSKGGKMDEMGNDFVLKVPSDICARIQEMHITVGHIMCEVIEKELYGRK
ncbi:MAG: SIS domain-containing protein [Candidatus Nanoarchaeia archaeon]|nr:SIS domain-containing protein [Candidatus Nanoarchaeia archaeon]